MGLALKENVEQLLAPGNRAELSGLLYELQPYDIAIILSDLDEGNRLRVLGALPPDAAAEALSHLDYDTQYRLLDHLEDSAFRAILSAMPNDALADLIGAIHPRQAREVLGRVPEEDLAEVRRLMSYPESSAGGRMSPDYLAARAEWTADQVIAHFRKVGRETRDPSYVYVVDNEGRLVGVTSMRNVLLSDPGARVREFMSPRTITVPAEADQEEVAAILSRYDFVALPVTNGGGRMVGIITVDDVLDVMEEEATEDIQRLGGTQPLDQPYLQASILQLFGKRIGWLLILFVGGAFTATIMRRYEAVLMEAVALAFFVPLIIATGGNSGAQAATLVIRALALGEVTVKDFLRVIWREARVGLALAAAMAVAAFARAMMMGGSAAFGFTVASTIALMVVVGAVIGAALPLVARRFGVDPAVFSAPFITTVADAAGLLIYFQMARLFLGLGA